ncbi:MAG: hypothetical protein A2X56_14920 [Nitrospirae bacterium GWC2_57_13]|nr:MAG: hypothetical protein A2072_02945 [Nitrospirae bacterium GWC1_57_7]OGW28884.1 MAG: hypothetical protein A2X56_14920 [Nitrospirae bacterium GWC2_57_13]
MVQNMLPDRSYIAELRRPWKLASFAIGMAWLLFGALNYGISDWDVGISLLMGGLTYLCAPWSVRVILVSLRFRPKYWLLWIGSAVAVALVVIDGVYYLYHSIVGNEMLRRENFYASSALYFLSGTIWLYRGSLRDFVADFRALRSMPRITGARYKIKIRWIVSALLILMIGGSFAVYPVDHYRISKFCGSIIVNESIEAVRSRALEHSGFRITENYEREGTCSFIIHSPRSFGRFTCFVENDGKAVTKAKFNDFD